MKYVPLILSTVVIAAHFLRGGNVVVVALILCAPLLLLLRQRWTVIALQAGLAIAALEWIRTALAIAHERAATGAPVARMFVILGSVALFTALSAIPLRRVTPS